MSKERTSAGNILAVTQAGEEKAKDVEEAATSYMPTNIDLEALMPAGSASAQAETGFSEPDSSKIRMPASLENKRIGVQGAQDNGSCVSKTETGIALS